jgi:type I restriction enzyme M protein
MNSHEMKILIDSLWSDFWADGITKPLTVIEQITFLLYSRLLDIEERNDEELSKISGAVRGRRFEITEQDCRWESWRHLSGPEMLLHVKDRVFPHFRRLAERGKDDGSQFAAFMKDARLMIENGSLLVKAVTAVHSLPLEQGEDQGDTFEYLLSKLTTAGVNGQFRTPRHIIKMMVDLMQPKPTERICDPSCGTGGFLVESYQYLLRQNSSKAGTHVTSVNGQEQVAYSGDLIGDHRHHVDTGMFHAYDFDATMLRIAFMNLVMHGVKQPDVNYQDTLSPSFEERHPKDFKNAFDLILANPPFSGSLLEQDVAPDLLNIVKTKKTELLFIALILRMLKIGGRGAIIVPNNVLFGSTKAHVQLRQQLIENNRLAAVISLPSNVFKPYVGVTISIIIFAKGGGTEKVFFYDVQSDGYTQDNKRMPIGDAKGDLPDVLTKYRQWCDGEGIFADRNQKAFEVPIAEIVQNGFDLSINRYKAVQQESPQEILKILQMLEREMHADLLNLELLLK